MEGFKASLQAWLADPAGRYEALAMDFDWQRTPFTTWHTPAAICAVYLVVVALLTPRAQAMSKEFKELRKQGKARPVTLMTHVFAMHNLGVCLLSAAMFVGGAWEVYRRVTGAVTYGGSVQYGGGDQLHWQFLFCEDTSMQSKGPVFLWVRAEFAPAGTRRHYAKRVEPRGCEVWHTESANPRSLTSMLCPRSLSSWTPCTR